MPVRGDAVQDVKPLELQLGRPGEAPEKPSIVRTRTGLAGQAFANRILEQSGGQRQPEVAQSGAAVQERAGEGSGQYRREGRAGLLLTEPDQREVSGGSIAPVQGDLQVQFAV